MAVPVSFFHLDKATVDLRCGTEGAVEVLVEGVVHLPLVPVAKIRGFGLASGKYCFSSCSTYNHNLLKSVEKMIKY